MALEVGSEVFVPDLVSPSHPYRGQAAAPPRAFRAQSLTPTFFPLALAICVRRRHHWRWRPSYSRLLATPALGTLRRCALQGGDTIWRLVRDGAPGAFNIQGQIDQAPGSGPRHIVVRGDQLYTIHEDDSTLTQQTIPADTSVRAVRATANVSIVPPDVPAGAAMFAAELLLAEASAAPGSNFTQPFLYASNRNLGTQDPRGDAIAIYAVEPELTFVKHVFTGLDQIRGMELSGGSENEFLVAAGVAGSAGTIVLRRTQGGADLEIVATNTDIPTRTSFVWLEQ